jgi:phage shock protein PspC (stress-responsive transcriptional regulator)
VADWRGCQSEVMKLYRPKRGRVFAGVCLAVANRFGWSPTLVRVLTVLSIIVPGPQVVFYILLWILIPGEKD